MVRAAPRWRPAPAPLTSAKRSGAGAGMGKLMFVDWLLASFHHLAVFSLAAILSAEIFLTLGPIDDRIPLRLARVDAWFGIMAAIALAAGLLRVFLGANTFFWLKMALFAAVALISIAPT